MVPLDFGLYGSPEFCGNDRIRCRFRRYERDTGRALEPAAGERRSAERARLRGTRGLSDNYCVNTAMPLFPRLVTATTPD
jgi:hypothetical protein